MAAEITAALLIGLLALPAAWAAQRTADGGGGGGQLVQCWSDDRGQRVCGDRVPPSDARRERDFYDRRGVVKKIIPAEKSSSEVAAEAQAQKDAESRAAYDRYLMQTYRGTDEIQSARDQRLATLDGRTQLVRKSLVDSETALDDLRKRGVDPDDPESSPQLKQQIADFEKSSREQRAALDSLASERDKVMRQSSYDMDRFRELRAGRGRPPG